MELIDEGNVTGLFDLLAVKQKPLSDIQRIEKALDPYRAQDPERRPWPSAADRAACGRLVEECDKLLREIVVQEKHCEETMVQKRDATAIQLQRLRAAGQAHGAYTAPVSARRQPNRPEFRKVRRTMSQSTIAIDPADLGRQRRSADDPGRLAHGHAPPGADAQRPARRGPAAHRRTGSQEPRAGPQESPGRPGADGFARGPRGPQQPRAGHALLEPASPPADCRLGGSGDARQDQRRLPGAGRDGQRSAALHLRPRPAIGSVPAAKAGGRHRSFAGPAAGRAEDPLRAQRPAATSRCRPTARCFAGRCSIWCSTPWTRCPTAAR